MGHALVPNPSCAWSDKGSLVLALRWGWSVGQFSGFNRQRFVSEVSWCLPHSSSDSHPVVSHILYLLLHTGVHFSILWSGVLYTHSVHVQHLSAWERSAFRPVFDSWRWRSRGRGRWRTKGRSRGRSPPGQFGSAAFVLLPFSFSSYRKQRYIIVSGQ